MSRGEMLLMAGAPGSGKSRLGKELAAGLTADGYPALHVSAGDTVRATARGDLPHLDRYSAAAAEHLNSQTTRMIGDFPFAVPESLTPLSDDLIYGILVTHLLAAHRNAQVVILDGYPRSEAQLDDAFQLANVLECSVAGVIVTTTSRDVALARQIKRNHRDDRLPIDEQSARWRIDESERRLEPMLDALADPLRYNVPTYQIDTTKSKLLTNKLGLAAARTALHLLPAEDLERNDVYNDQPDRHQPELRP